MPSRLAALRHRWQWQQGACAGALLLRRVLSSDPRLPPLPPLLPLLLLLQEVSAQREALQADNRELQDKYNQKAMYVCGSGLGRWMCGWMQRW